jgi:hypothetical protein
VAYKQVLLLYTIYTATCKLSRDHTFILNVKLNERLQSFQLLQFSGTMTVLSHGECQSNNAQIVSRGITSYSILTGFREKCAGWDISVGVATCYGLNGPGIELRRGRYFPHPSRPAPRPSQSPVQWVPGLFRVQSCRSVGLTNHPI